MTPSTARARLPRARSLLAAPVSTAMLLGALVAAPLTGPLAAPAQAAASCTDGAVVGKEPISLGVGCLGNLDPAALGTGLAFGYSGDTPRDGLAGATGNGAPSEGWGVVDTIGSTEGKVAAGSSDGLTLVDFTVGQGTDGSDQTVTSVVRVGDAFEVTHFYRPTSQEGVYAVDVEIENISGAFTEVNYRRIADLDVEPTGGNEVVTLQTGSTTKLAHLSDDGFATPSAADGPSFISAEGDVLDAGPGDLGVKADLALGGLPDGASKLFTLYYGAAPNESLALGALYALDAEAYALGQNSDPEGPTEGTPVSYLLGFAGLGGTPMRAPHAGEDTYTVPPGETSTLFVTLNDSPDGSVPATGLEIAWVEQGWGGTVTCGTATCDYTPSPGSLSDYFRYLLSDGHGGFAIGEVTILVEEPEPAATNDARPTITGSGVVGEELTGHDGDWTSTGEPDGSDLTFDRQWMKDGSPITGETGSTYTPVEADLGHELTFQVIASRPDADPVVATSDPLTVTDERAATNDVRPSISGSGEVGGTLFGDDGSWTSGGGGDGSDLTFARQWLRDGTPIDGETGDAYTPSSGDVGSQITFQVTVSRAGADDVVATSDPVTVYRPVAAESTGPPMITGSGVFGEELTGSDGEWISTGASDGSDLSFSRRWLRDGSPIPGATGLTYTPVAADVDHDLVLEVRASRSGADDSTAYSAPLTVTPAAAPQLTTETIPVRGRPEVFQTLSVLPLSWDVEPDSVSYLWEYANNGIGHYAELPQGRSSSAYLGVPVSYLDPNGYTGQIGAVRVTVTAEKAGHRDAVVTRTFSTVRLAPALVITEAPTLSGAPDVGQTLTASTGAWSPEAADTHYVWRWYVNGVFQTQRVVDGDFLLDPQLELVGLDHDRLRDGDRVGVRVAAIQPGREASRLSPLTEVTLGLPAGTVTAPPGILGTLKAGETLTVDPAEFTLADGVDPRDVDVTTSWFLRWRNHGVRRPVQSDSDTFVLPDWAAGYYVEVEQTLSADRRTSVTAVSDRVGPVAAKPQLVPRFESLPLPTPRAGTQADLATLTWQAYPRSEAIDGVDTMTTWLVDGVEMADGPTYTPADAQVGGYLAARIKGTKDGYSDGGTTVSLGKVRPADEDEAVLDIRVVRSDDPLVRTAANVVICSAFTCLSSYAPAGTTTFTVPASTGGTEFSLKVYPAASLIEHHGSVTLTGGQTTQLTVELDAPTPLDPDVELSDADTKQVDTDGDGIPDTEVPSVYYRDPQTLTLHGCTGLTGRVWRVVFSNGDPSMEGPLTETEPGVYVGEIPGFSSTGWARVVTTLLRDCADDETFDFTIYIDPSGIVTDQFGRPLPGMDVTLLKAGDDGNGVTAFLPVADGDTSVMDPSINTANPSATDGIGFFRWDVTPGDYQVRVTPGLDTEGGCEVFTTDPMTVPPERIDLVLRVECPEVERPEPTTAPELTGTLAVGETLSVTEGEWPEPFVPMRTVWLRNGEAVGTGSTYEVTEADLGAEVVARVQAIRPDYVQENGTGEVVRFDPTWVDVAAGALTSPSSLTVKVTPKKLRERAKPKVTVKVRTEGAAAPTGAVKLLLKPKGSTKGKRVKKTVVLAEGDRPVVRVRLPKVRKGKYLLLVRYAGDDLVEKARTVRKTLRVKAR